MMVDRTVVSWNTPFLYKNLSLVHFKGKALLNTSRRKSFLAVSSESGMTTEATRKALMKNQIIIKGYLDLAKKTLKPVSLIPAGCR